MDHMPQLFVARLTRRRRAEVKRDEVMTFELYDAGFILKKK